MKKIIALILCVGVLLCLYGCDKTKDREENNASHPASSQSTSEQNTNAEPDDTTEPANIGASTDAEGEYLLYGNADQYLFVHNNIDFGSFDQPHTVGDSVRLRHSDIHTGIPNLAAVDIYDYNVTFQQILTGEEAVQKLKALCSNFDEETYLLAENDVYLIQVHVKYNAESAIKDRLPVDIDVAAVNAQGKYVNAEHRLDDSSYTSQTKNGEVSNWYPVFIPKDENAKPVFAIGSPMEFPGRVAAVYVDVAR